MKRVFILPVLFCLFNIQALSALDRINDDPNPLGTNALEFHSTGILSYGAHTNTFNLREYFIRGSYTIGDAVLFAAINGFKDTHEPANTYGYILDNINLYDYGVYYRFLNLFFLSLRGAAVYRPDMDTWLLIPAYHYTNDPGEFDSPAQYMPMILTAPGIRAGLVLSNFEVGYSQGDCRHSIPIAAYARYAWQDLSLRAYLHFENGGAVYGMDLWTWALQLSAEWAMQAGDFKFGALGDCMYDQKTNAYYARVEVMGGWNDYSLALRVFYNSSVSNGLLFEGSVQKNFFGLTDLGFFASSDGRIYFADRVNF